MDIIFDKGKLEGYFKRAKGYSLKEQFIDENVQKGELGENERNLLRRDSFYEIETPVYLKKFNG